MSIAGSITGDIKSLLSIRLKPRHDGMCDQYSRIFMVKLLLVSTIIIGVNQYKDTISCIVPEDLDICNGEEDPDTSCDFIHAACWIQGLYIYKQMADRVNDVAYFGMPKNIDHDGYINGTTTLCSLKPRMGVKSNPNCVPLEKTFYLQYQWMAFFVASLAILYYLPYVMFCKVNDDLICLRRNLKIDKTPTEQIMNRFFKKDSHTRIHAKVRLLLNVIVKVLYVCANFISFLSMDNVLYGEYADYGRKWVEWSRLHNTLMYDYMGMRDFPKPGNRLLPPFGYCEFYESAKDIKQSRANKFKIVCELSQHILYQYSFLLLWFCFVIGMIVSVLGLLHLLWTYFSNFITIKCHGNYGITLREMDYIMYIKTRDSNLYGDVMIRLKQNGEQNGIPKKSIGRDKTMVYFSCCRQANHVESD